MFQPNIMQQSLVQLKTDHHLQKYICLIVVSHSFVTLWPTACQASLSMGFHRQEYWGGLPWPPPGDLPNPEIKPMYPLLVGGFFFYH